jgi:hypothetical protein
MPDETIRITRDADFPRPPWDVQATTPKGGPMELQELTVSVPAPLHEGGEITRARLAAFGEAAAQVGSPDYGMNGSGADGAETDGADAIANLLHWIASQGGDVDLALERARRNFDAEHGEGSC